LLDQATLRGLAPVPTGVGTMGLSKKATQLLFSGDCARHTKITQSSERKTSQKKRGTRVQLTLEKEISTQGHAGQQRDKKGGAILLSAAGAIHKRPFAPPVGQQLRLKAGCMPEG